MAVNRRLAAALLALVAAGSASTVTTPAQESVITRETIALAGDRIRADRWYWEEMNPGSSQAGKMNRSTDLDLLRIALAQPFPALRAAAIREFGRFQNLENVELIAQYLADPVVQVREEALDALAQTLLDKSESAIAPWIGALETRLLVETPAMVGEIWRTLAEWPLTYAVSLKYERIFLNEILQQTPMRSRALDALLALARNRRDRPFERSTDDRIHYWAMRGLGAGDVNVKIGPVNIGPTIRFIEILHAAQADGAGDVAIRATTFSCAMGGPACGSDIRALGVRLLNPTNPEHRPALMRAAARKSEPALSGLAIRKLIPMKEMPLCELLELSKDTGAELDVIKALGEQSAQDLTDRTSTCGDWSPGPALLEEASKLATTEPGFDWVRQSLSLEALVRYLPSDAQKLATEVAAIDKRWQVRVSAARVAIALKDEALLKVLGADDHHNVRAEVIRGLQLLNSPLVGPVALDALAKSDYRLLRVAATALQGFPEPATAMPPLMDALRRVTAEGLDTSRRVRVALLGRISEMFVPDLPDSSGWISGVRPLLTDFDPVVARAAAAVINKVAGANFEANPTRRPPKQPTVAQLLQLPTCVIIRNTEGPYLLLILNRGGAPITVARFLEAASADYFDGLTLHRLNENVAVYGSPGAHDEGGWPRFARDEPGATVRPMTMTILGHDQDALDGRLAVHLVEELGLTRRATVLARVEVVGMGLATAFSPTRTTTTRVVGRSLPTVGPLFLFNTIEDIETSGVNRAIRNPGEPDPCDPNTPWR
jgi:HEAT repeat protein